MRISEDIYTALILAFYNILVPSDKDNISLRSIIGSFKLQVLPSDMPRLPTLQIMAFCAGLEKDGGKNSIL